jgi:hypothetical protein
MRAILSGMILVCFVASVASRPQPAPQTEQDVKIPSVANQPSALDTTPQEIKFKLLRMSNGMTKNGFAYGGLTYETAAHIMVYVRMVHLDSREGAKKEYGNQLEDAVRMIEQGQIQDKPATKPPTTEDRAVVVVPSTRKDCKEIFTILATAGTVLRIQQSCSLESVIEWEKQAKRNESVDDRFVVRQSAVPRLIPNQPSALAHSFAQNEASRQSPETDSLRAYPFTGWCVYMVQGGWDIAGGVELGMMCAGDSADTEV